MDVCAFLNVFTYQTHLIYYRRNENKVYEMIITKSGMPFRSLHICLLLAKERKKTKQQ